MKKMTMDQCSRAIGPRFIVGQHVRVVDLGKPGHVRTPDYILDRTGVVIQMCGMFLNPEDLSIGITHGPVVALYRVSFNMSDVWDEPERNSRDTLCVEIYDHWLEEVNEGIR